MGKTAQLNVNSSTYTAIPVTTSDCKRVIIYEDDQAGTTDYYISATGSDSDRVTKPAGAKKEFASSSFYNIGTISYIKSAVGSVTFCKEEEGA